MGAAHGGCVVEQQGVIAGRVPAHHRRRVVEDRALLADVKEDLDEGQVGVLVRHLGHRVDTHYRFTVRVTRNLLTQVRKRGDRRVLEAEMAQRAHRERITILVVDRTATRAA